MMARIRSIKPDFWTDEKVVTMSAFARLFFIGLWNFADDEGRGEFSPIGLRLKILPADQVDIESIITEIEGQGLIRVYSVDGKSYFEVRGFVKHQKIDKRTPSKLPPPPLDSPEFPRIPPNSNYGKEGEKERKGSTALLDGRANELCEALGVTDETKTPGLLSLSDPLHWLASGCDMDADILPTLRSIAARGTRVTSWAYCTKPVFAARDRRLAPAPPVEARGNGPPPNAGQHRNAGIIGALADIARKAQDERTGIIPEIGTGSSR